MVYIYTAARSHVLATLLVQTATIITAYAGDVGVVARIDIVIPDHRSVRGKVVPLILAAIHVVNTQLGDTVLQGQVTLDLLLLQQAGGV